jgi:hypothetical protein
MMSAQFLPVDFAVFLGPTVEITQHLYRCSKGFLFAKPISDKLRF